MYTIYDFISKKGDEFLSTDQNRTEKQQDHLKEVLLRVEKMALIGPKVHFKIC